LFHAARSGAPAGAGLCLPDGIGSWWAGGVAVVGLTAEADRAVLRGHGAADLVRTVAIGGRHGGAASLSGESVGVWTADGLAVWTAGIAGWRFGDGLPEYSDALEIVEVFARDAEGALTVTATFYDGQALVRPL